MQEKISNADEAIRDEIDYHHQQALNEQMMIWSGKESQKEALKALFDKFFNQLNTLIQDFNQNGMTADDLLRFKEYAGNLSVMIANLKTIPKLAEVYGETFTYLEKLTAQYIDAYENNNELLQFKLTTDFALHSITNYTQKTSLFYKYQINDNFQNLYNDNENFAYNWQYLNGLTTQYLQLVQNYYYNQNNKDTTIVQIASNLTLSYFELAMNINALGKNHSQYQADIFQQFTKQFNTIQSALYVAGSYVPIFDDLIIDFVKVSYGYHSLDTQNAAYEYMIKHYNNLPDYYKNIQTHNLDNTLHKSAEYQPFLHAHYSNNINNNDDLSTQFKQQANISKLILFLRDLKSWEQNIVINKNLEIAKVSNSQFTDIDLLLPTKNPILSTIEGKLSVYQYLHSLLEKDKSEFSQNVLLNLDNDSFDLTTSHYFIGDNQNISHYFNENAVINGNTKANTITIANGNIKENTIYGNNGNDIYQLNGGLLNNIKAGKNNDTFRIGSALQTIITDIGCTDNLIFEQAIENINIKYLDNNLYFAFNNQQVQINNAFVSANKIENITINGTKYTQDKFFQTYRLEITADYLPKVNKTYNVAVATSTDYQTITTFKGNDKLIAAHNNAILQGAEGNDIYTIDNANNVKINDIKGQNILEFDFAKVMVNGANLELYKSEQQITIENFFAKSGNNYILNKTSTWQTELTTAIKNELLTNENTSDKAYSIDEYLFAAVHENSILRGTTKADIIVDNHHSNRYDGGAGNDTYIFHKDFGKDTITDNNGISTIKFIDFNKSDIIASKYQKNLLISEKIDGTNTATNIERSDNLLTFTSAYTKANIDKYIFEFENGDSYKLDLNLNWHLV